jgi:bifunctional ADP-heptose synthase (sugar kinase/adenylyltransferase)
MIGASGKTPTLSTKRIKSERFVGGAAVVAMHVAASGANAEFISLIGEDQEGDFVRQALDSLNIKNHLFVEPGRPTTLKETFDVDGYRLLKVDRVSNAPIGSLALKEILHALPNVNVDTHIFSDFRHGIFNSSTASR